MKKFIATFISIIFLFISFWLGESGRGLFQNYLYIVGLIGIVTVPLIVSRKWKYRTLVGFLFVVLYSVVFVMGNHSFYRAYNSCLEEAEQIRLDLAEYKFKNGRYPETLYDLDVKLPCLRLLRGTILKYESTATNYKICFEDWLVEHVATDREPFLAHK